MALVHNASVQESCRHVPLASTGHKLDLHALCTSFSYFLLSSERNIQPRLIVITLLSPITDPGLLNHCRLNPILKLCLIAKTLLIPNTDPGT
jgi:hypothetical protein